MSDTTAKDADVRIPSKRDVQLAVRAGHKLAALREGADPVPIRFGPAAAEAVAIPTPAVRLLKEILDHMAHGFGVALTPLHAELTTRQAADLLQVSRTHLVQLLDEGRIPCRMVGSHRRVRTSDILEIGRASCRERV